MCGKNSLIHQRGFSLVELIVVIAIISTLLAISWFQFSAYTRKSQMESQTHILYGDLVEARTKALYEKKIMTLQFTANSYTIAADGAVVTTRKLAYPVEWNNAANVEYGTTGLLNNAAAEGKTICIAQANDAPVDSVVISMTRVQIGKRKEGADCVSSSDKFFAK